MYFSKIEREICTVRKQSIDQDNTIEIKLIELKGKKFFRLLHNKETLGDYETLSKAIGAYYARWLLITGEPKGEQTQMFK